ncbi:MAG: hypothetical protein MZV64_29735 [Ignavibacteriales bacterium]|nr:hypothetical protein [Ignavibacteriales bacterium]
MAESVGRRRRRCRRRHDPYPEEKPRRRPSGSSPYQCKRCLLTPTPTSPSGVSQRYVEGGRFGPGASPTSSRHDPRRRSAARGSERPIEAPMSGSAGHRILAYFTSAILRIATKLPAWSRQKYTPLAKPCPAKLTRCRPASWG